MVKRGLVVAAVIVSAACGGGAVPVAGGEPELVPGSVVDATPTDLRAVISGPSGRPLVVNYWATWCGPCVVETPRLVDAARRYADEVDFLGVDVEDDPDEAARFLVRFDVPYPSLGDPKGDIKRDQRIVGLPTTQFFRADGELAFVHSGEISVEDLDERIAELVRVGTPATPPA